MVIALSNMERMMGESGPLSCGETGAKSRGKRAKSRLSSLLAKTTADICVNSIDLVGIDVGRI
jgi:hypothetical protein